jgi:transposase-like protein
MENRVHIYFKDLMEYSNYTFLEESKDSLELQEIAKRRNIKLPSPDLAIFRCIYALCDRPNLNGCILPTKEVSRALDTLVGKPIDVDHIRNRTIGHWIDKKLEDGKIYAYGAIWKDVYKEEYEEAKKRMDKKNLKVSFESWGDRKYLTAKKYNLHNLHFAGGAMLFDTDPAFKEASVLDLGHTHNHSTGEELRVLEFASVVKNTIEDSATATLIKCQHCKYEFDYHSVIEFKPNCVKCPKCFAIIDQTGKVLQLPQIMDFSVSCPSCKAMGWEIIEKSNEGATIKCTKCTREFEVSFEIGSDIKIDGLLDAIYLRKIPCPQCGSGIDYGGFFSDKEVEVKCKKCGIHFPYKAEYKIAKKKIKKIKEKRSKTCSGNSKEGGQNMKLDDIKKLLEEAKQTDILEKVKEFEKACSEELTQLAKSKEDLTKSVEESKKKIESLEKEIVKIKEESKKEVEKVKADAGTKLKDSEVKLEESKTKLKESEVKLKESEEAHKKELDEIAKKNKDVMDKEIAKVKTITERRIGLGEFADNMSDEDLLDATKYENAQLKLQLAIKEGKKINKAKLEIGTKNKGNDSSVWESQKNVQKKAYPEK